MFIGDGLTDRCIAEEADLVFARDALAEHLAEQGLAFRAYGDFYDIAERIFGQGSY